uniref:CCHC-type domain-containing protein n=1 Tax=Lactuca sativa TaxID=4236 RepID=A0A9R1VZH4_LACSA|nr:hypothetical protein LSAT_V11C400194320 [Lactuca sativa]
MGEPPVFNGEIDPILSSTWIMDIEGTFDTRKCVDEDKFTEKARFVEFYVSTKERRVERYIWGLRTAIHEFVQIQKSGTFQSVVDATEGREREKNRQGEDRALGKRKWDGTNNDSKKIKTSSQECKTDLGSRVKQCPKCNCYHKGECNMNQKCGKPGHIATKCKKRRLCYGCGSPNHINSECPQSKGNNNQGRITNNRATDKKADTGRPKARTFHLMAQEAQETPDVVTGTFLVNSIHARVLFDSGANRSLVSTTFCKNLVRNAKTLEHALEIETADDHWVLVREEYDDCSNEIEGGVVPLNLLPIPWVILTFYWAYVLEAKQGKPEIPHIPVIREFQDVFLVDLTSLPPDRKVEFRIDLTPAVALIARAPYQLAPTEMKELMAQLHDLHNKGFIRPSTSPWGAPLLFVKKKDGKM